MHVWDMTPLYEGYSSHIRLISSPDNNSERRIKTASTIFQCGPLPLQPIFFSHLTTSFCKPSVYHFFFFCNTYLNNWRTSCLTLSSYGYTTFTKAFIPFFSQYVIHSNSGEHAAVCSTNTEERSTVSSTNTLDSQQWISAGFEPFVTRDFITICCSYAGLNWSDTICNNQARENSCHLQIPPLVIKHILFTLQ